MTTHWLASVAAIAGVSAYAIVANPPSKDIKPIEDVVKMLELQGYGPFSEIGFDNGCWEVEVYKGDVACELTVDPHNGVILSEHRDDGEPRPPRGSLQLSEILQVLVKAGYSNIRDIAFERRYWEIESYHNNDKREIHVHPKTGEIISDRHDD